MTTSDFPVEQLSDLQIIELLSLASPLAEFERLTSLSSAELIQVARQRLQENTLDTTAASELAGVNELTTKRWFESAGELNEQAKLKLAALCLLLSLKDDSVHVAESTRLVREAVAHIRRHNRLADDGFGADKGNVVRSVFGPSGLMAAALHLCTESATVNGVYESAAQK